MAFSIPNECDRCGARLKKGGFKRIRADKCTMASYPDTRWITDEFLRYYCPKCAAEVKKAIRRCEIEGR